MRDFILNFVLDEGGCKFCDLYLACIKNNYAHDQIASTVSQLVQEKELIEVRFYIKDIHGERMGFILPKDTSVRIMNPIF